MKIGKIIESVFMHILKEYLLRTVLERCKQEYAARPRNYVITPCTPVSRLKCPSCQRLVVARKFTWHLSRCMKLDHAGR
ncbi:hypothetical protein PFJ87_03g01350 [Encephalitozoon hellem]|uniref:SAGA-associated factor 11 n=1 Tax=Encephalitozoon hellem TaxID=27973 RepID=A0A9Q9F975_ENCHE|nr:hypothetical protein GPU96_03g05400 [Encephalitozoon hellem]WEL38276.1 hypothetical protein PFJ87_03g01350 [Encephalitozoon hellem]